MIELVILVLTIFSPKKKNTYNFGTLPKKLKSVIFLLKGFFFFF